MEVMRMQEALPPDCEAHGVAEQSLQDVFRQSSQSLAHDDGLTAFASTQLSAYLKEVTQGPSKTDVAALAAALAKCSRAAAGLCKLGRLPQASKHLERGLTFSAGRESEHPVVALEAARLRLNLGWLLSRTGRHFEALHAIAQAHRLLRHVITWSDDCGKDDPCALAIGVEATSLQSAAVIAEAVELEPLVAAGSLPGSPPPTAGSGEIEQPRPSTSSESHNRSSSDTSHQGFLDRYAMACSFVESRLPEQHLAVATAQRLHREAESSWARSILAEEEQRPETVPLTTRPSTSCSGGRPRTTPSRPGLPALRFWSKASETQRKRAPFARRGALAKTKSFMDAEGAAAIVKQNKRASFFPKGKNAPNDIFAEYVHDDKFEKEMRWERRAGEFGESRYEDMKKQLFNQRRLVKLAGSAAAELGDVKYSAIGHSMQMKTLSKGNVTRSMPSLMFEAKIFGRCPEAVHMQMIGRDIRPAKTEPDKRRISLALGLRTPLLHKDSSPLL